MLPQRHSQDSRLWVYAFDAISSTQDEAKRLCAEDGFTTAPAAAADDDDDDETTMPPPPPTSFVVTTREQSQGRGTNGRVWMGQPGNVFVTLGIRQDDWMRSGIPLTLLPLQVGSMVAQHVHHYLMSQCRRSSSNSSSFFPTVTVKWPNDVLVNEQKIAGILIESSTSSQGGGWFLIGIGVNLAYAPSITSDGPNRGRPATSLASWCHHNFTTTNTTATQTTAAEDFGVALGYDLHSFVQQQAKNEGGTTAAAPQQILDDWKKWIDWDLELELRDTPGREKVKMVDVLPDGRIQVEHLKDGRRQTLVSDYFL